MQQRGNADDHLRVRPLIAIPHPNVNKLKDLIWSDLCVREDPSKGWLKAASDSMVVSPLPSDSWEELKQLFLALNRSWDQRGAVASRYGFPMEWPPEDGMRLRAKRIQLANGEHVYVCRAFRFKPFRLQDTGIAAPLVNKLLSPEIRGGIGIILGRPGAGKTTTAYSFLQERARRLGGVTWTIESPVEMDHLEGRYENGYIHQIEVETPEILYETVKDLARATPNVLFVGEVLDDQTAEVVAQASKMGFLVLCTYHGGDLINGIERFARAAGHGIVSAQFVDAFRFAVHIDLRMVETGGRARPINDSLISSLETGNPPRVLSARSLFCISDADPIRGHMKKGEFAQLQSEIDRQKNELLKLQSEMSLGRAR
ncbi:GspE family protein [Pandoraea cepalis]|uniref:GspE family protein n=1 Tax=Pandoraea cepalis TaxID=2508294 RepID=A0A5E4W533_9BURK|nr:GspE family protein [Pandoraea cepalis]